MDTRDYLRIAPLINDCPQCGSDETDGTISYKSVNDNLVKRVCKCGFNFEYDVRNGTTKRKLQLAIEKAIVSE